MSYPGYGTLFQVYGIKDQYYQDVLSYDSFVSVKLQEQMTVSTFPVEQGAFASYNKSSHPFKITVKLAVSGDAGRRRSFLSDVRALMKSTNLVNIVTPDATYLNATLVSYDYNRDAQHNGWGRVVADLHFEEVRIVALQYTSTVVRDPSAATPASTGRVSEYKLHVLRAAGAPITIPKRG